MTPKKETTRKGVRNRVSVDGIATRAGDTRYVRAAPRELKQFASRKWHQRPARGACSLCPLCSLRGRRRADAPRGECRLHPQPPRRAALPGVAATDRTWLLGPRDVPASTDTPWVSRAHPIWKGVRVSLAVSTLLPGSNANTGAIMHPAKCRLHIGVACPFTALTWLLENLKLHNGLRYSSIVGVPVLS